MLELQMSDHAHAAAYLLVSDVTLEVAQLLLVLLLQLLSCLCLFLKVLPLSHELFLQCCYLLLQLLLLCKTAINHSGYMPGEWVIATTKLQGYSCL